MHHKNFFMVPNRIFDLELKPRDFTCIIACFGTATMKMVPVFPHRELSQKSAVWIGKPLTLPSKLSPHLVW